MKKKWQSFCAAVTVTYMQMQFALATDLGGLDVTNDDHGVTISPGKFPSLQGDIADTVQQINGAIGKYRVLGGFILLAITLTLLAVFVYLLMRFAGSSNPQDKKTNMLRLGLCAAAIALMGGLDVIVAMSWNIFS